MLQHRFRISSLGGLLLTAGVIAGALFNYATDFAPRQSLVYGLLAAFCALYVAEFFLLPRYPRSLYAYLPAQTLIVAALLLLPPLLDTFAILYVAVLMQVTPVMQPRASLLLAGLFAAVAGATFLLDEGFPGALGQIFVYGAAYLLVAGFNINLLRLEEARRESEAYAAQVEELAVVEERNRLARELHDSVTQTLFGMTFTAETARARLASSPEEVPPLLDRLQEDAASALAEMRALVYELRPARAAGDSLASALREHAALLQRQHGLVVDVTAAGEEYLTPVQAHRLFRVAQEALNNVVKHAGVASAQVDLRFSPEQVALTVADQGQGFDPSAAAGSGVGLQSMRERVESLGGRLTVVSQPGQGTRIQAVVPLNSSGPA